MRRQVIIDPTTQIVRLGGRPPRVTMRLLAVMLALFVLYAFADGPAWVARHLAVSASGALGRLELWQPFTALWLHLTAQSALLDLLSLWVFGSALERWWGGRRFLLFFVVCGIVGIVAGMSVALFRPGELIWGSAGSSMAMIAACGILFPRHLVHLHALLGIKGRTFVLVAAAVMMLNNLMPFDGLSFVVEGGGALAALGWLSAARRSRSSGGPRPPREPRLRAIPGGKQSDPLRWN